MTDTDLTTAEQDALVQEIVARRMAAAQHGRLGPRDQIIEKVLATYREYDQEEPQIVIGEWSPCSTMIASTFALAYLDNERVIPDVRRQLQAYNLDPNMVEEINRDVASQLGVEPRQFETNSKAVEWPQWLYGNQDAGWIGWCELWYRLGELDAIPPLMELLTLTGWSIAWEGLFVTGAPPVELLLDAQDRLHNGEGPAIRWADGYEIYALEGVAVEKAYFGYEASRILDIENVEERRVMRNWYGPKFMEELGADELDRADDVGAVLYRLGDLDGEPLVALGLTDPYPSLQDGKRRSYLITVPPEMTDARVARLWHMGFEAEEMDRVVVIEET